MGNPKLVENYRPISLLSAPAKIFESILYIHIFNHVKINISTNQHGFMPRRSTLTNLLNFTHYVSSGLDKRKQVDVIYTDFQKAFDKVDHDILINKLTDYNFASPLLTLIVSYLSNRSQVV